MFVTKLGENFIEGITLFKGKCKACNSEFYFEEKEAKELYEKGEIGHSEEEMLRVSMGEPYYRYEFRKYPPYKVPILITRCPCCDELVKLDQVTCTHETYAELKNKHRITLEHLAEYNGIYPLNFKCPNSRLSVDMKNRIEKSKALVKALAGS
jgi:hypothetical protein